MRSHVLSLLCGFLFLASAAHGEEGKVRPATAELPVGIPHIPADDSGWILGTEGEGGTPQSFQFEVAYESLGKEAPKGDGGRLVVERDGSWSGAAFSTWWGIPYVHFAERGRECRFTLPEHRPGGGILIVQEGNFEIRLTDEEERLQIIYPEGKPRILLNLAELTENVLYQSSERDFDKPTLTARVEIEGFRGSVTFCDAFERQFTGSPIAVIAMEIGGMRQTVRNIRIKRPPPRSILVYRHEIPLPENRIFNCAFDSPAGKGALKRFQRLWFTLPEPPFHKPQVLEPSLALLDTFQLNSIAPPGPGAVAEFRKLVRTTETDAEAFLQVRERLDASVISPTVQMPLKDLIVARTEYRRAWAWDRLELVFGPVATREFAEAARDAVSDGTLPIASRCAWLDLLGETGLPLDSRYSQDLVAAVSRSRDRSLTLVMASVQARTGIPSQDESDRLLAAVADETLPLDVRCIALESVCLRHRFAELDQEMLWRMLPAMNDGIPKPLLQRVLFAFLVDPNGLKWWVETHDGVMLKALGRNGLAQVGIRVRAAADDFEQESGEATAATFVDHVRRMAFDESLDDDWRAAAAAEGGWGEGGRDFARKFLSEVSARSSAAKRRAALTAAWQAGLPGEIAGLLRESLKASDRSLVKTASRTVLDWARKSGSDAHAETLWPMIDLCLDHADLDVKERGLNAAWHLLQRGITAPPATVKKCQTLERSHPSLLIQCVAMAICVMVDKPDAAKSIPRDEDGDISLDHHAGWWRENREALRKAWLDK